MGLIAAVRGAVHGRRHGAGLRVLHGPVNVCGIPGDLCAWLRAHDVRAHSVVWQENPLFANSDQVVGLEGIPRPLAAIRKLSVFARAALRYEVFHFYFGVSLLPYNADLPLLRLLGRKLVMSYCGSEIRLSDVESTFNPHAGPMQFGADHPSRDAPKRWRMRWQRLWIHRVTAPRELVYSAREVFPAWQINTDVWVNNSLDLEALSPSGSPPGDPPLVVHAPSNPRVKGTARIEATLEQLRAKGVRFRYRRVEGLPVEAARRIYREDADVIVDQLHAGAFGTLAAEAMACGKPVVTYLTPRLVEDALPDCPIVNASVETLPEVLEGLLTQPEERERIGRAGRAYAEQHFDRNRIGRALLELYRTL